VALSGGPLLLFVIFTTTVFVFSLIAALVIGLVAALLFTAFMLLVALFIVLPTVFMTTMASTFIWTWAMGGYYIFKWFNQIEAPGEKGEALGDKINDFSGGRLSWLMDGARNRLRPYVGGPSEKDSLLSTPGNGLSTSRVSTPSKAPTTPVKAKDTTKTKGYMSTPTE
jgi:hypothetical protein